MYRPNSFRIMNQKHFFVAFSVVLLTLWSFTSLRANAKAAAADDKAAAAPWLQGDSFSV